VAHNQHAKLIRINPTEPHVPPELDAVGIPLGAKDAMIRIIKALQ
jgi:hypothetical protein